MEQMSVSSESRGLYCHAIGMCCTDCSIKPAQWISCVIPADRTTAHASVVGDTARSCHHISVSAPFIAIVPASACIEVDDEDDPRGIVLALNLARLRETASIGYGTTTCDIPCWVTAWDPFLREVADKISTLHAGTKPDPECFVAFAAVISLHLAARYGRAGTHEEGAALSHLKLGVVEDFIDKHIAENIPVERLAAVVHMSPSHFAHAFKNATGLTPHLYLTTKRLKYAELMLIEGVIPLIDVAARAGYRTQQHFTAVFHQYTGYTPRAFRFAHVRPERHDSPAYALVPVRQNEARIKART